MRHEEKGESAAGSSQQPDVSKDLWCRGLEYSKWGWSVLYNSIKRQGL